MEKDQVKKLEAQGYKVRVENDSAGTDYPAHSHPHETKIIALEGSMQLQIGDFWQSATIGKEYIIPKDTSHAVKVGGQGCKYILAEK